MLRDILYHLAGIIVEQRIMLQDKEAVVVLVKDGHKLEAGEGTTHIHLGDVAVQAAQDTGVVAADEEDFVPLQVGIAVDGIYQHLWRGDQDIEGIFKQGDCWVQFDFHDRE